MSHHHRKAVLLAALTLLAPLARGQDVKKAADPSTALAGPKVRELHVDPAAAIQQTKISASLDCGLAQSRLRRIVSRNKYGSWTT